MRNKIQNTDATIKKDTVGSISSSLLQKDQETRDPIALQREMQQKYLDSLIECAQRCKKNFPGDFFIVVITKNERLMKNVFRNYFFGRQSCPTPDYDQSVFKYSAADDNISFIWTIPDQQTSFMLKDNALIVAPEEQESLKFVLDFADGTLYKLAKKLNGESIMSPFLEK